jgi:hypothetical protein
MTAHGAYLYPKSPTFARIKSCLKTEYRHLRKAKSRGRRRFAQRRRGTKKDKKKRKKKRKRASAD